MAATMVSASLNNKFSKRKRVLLLVVSIVFLVVVVFVSLFVVYTFTVNGGGGGVSLEGGVFVGSEGELEAAVVDAGLVGGGGSTVVVVLTRDVFLSGPLVVGEGCNVTLTSSGGRFGGGFFRLVGAKERYTVVVEDGGWLCVDGVVITHNKSTVPWGGGGVLVWGGGEFVLVRGKISDNGYVHYPPSPMGGGVKNMGVFRMFGGEISNNKAEYVLYHQQQAYGVEGEGGGVYNGGVFEMFGGSIINNVAGKCGGGVCNEGEFTMYDGLIINNKTVGKPHLTPDCGGGVFNYGVGSFVMFGGLISVNRASMGGGVYSVGRGGVVFEGVVVFNLGSGWKGYNVCVVDKDGNVVG